MLGKRPFSISSLAEADEFLELFSSSQFFHAVNTMSIVTNSSGSPGGSVLPQALWRSVTPVVYKFHLESLLWRSLILTHVSYGAGSHAPSPQVLC